MDPFGIPHRPGAAICRGTGSVSATGPEESGGTAHKRTTLFSVRLRGSP